MLCVTQSKWKRKRSVIWIYRAYVSKSWVLANVGNGKLIRFQLSGGPFVAMHLVSSWQFSPVNFKWSVDLFALAIKYVERDFWFIHRRHTEMWSFLQRKSNRYVWPFCSMSSIDAPVNYSHIDWLIIFQRTIFQRTIELEFHLCQGIF